MNPFIQLKKAIPTSAHLLRGVFYLLLLLAVCVVPLTLAQSRSRETAGQSAGQPTQLAPSAAASALAPQAVPNSSGTSISATAAWAFASQASAVQKSSQAGQSRAASAAAAALTPGQRSIQIHKSPRHLSGSVLWYNGDYNNVNGLSNEDNTLLGSGEFGSVYDDFIVPSGPGWNVTSVFSDNLLENTNVTGAIWEIRQGVSEGNGGTLIASGMTMTPVVTPTGRCDFSFCEYMVEVIGLNVSLAEGTYWLNVTPIGDLTGRSFDTNTSGANCVGTPCGNNLNAFFNSNFFGANFTSTSNEGQPSDFSMGVEGSISGGSPTPTPSGTPTCTPGPLWYNGDFNGVYAIANEMNTSIGSGEFASVYDDFVVTYFGGWNITSVFSDNLLNTNVTGASWEIRTGISEGNGGTLVASGMTMTPVVTPTGRGGFGFTEYMVEVIGLNVQLPPLPAGQFYWLNVTPIGDLTGRSFDSNTSGANCVGTPCGNNLNSFWNSNFFGANFEDTGTAGDPGDFSMGVNGSAGSGCGSPSPTPTATATATATSPPPSPTIPPRSTPTPRPRPTPPPRP